MERAVSGSKGIKGPFAKAVFNGIKDTRFSVMNGTKSS